MKKNKCLKITIVFYFINVQNIKLSREIFQSMSIADDAYLLPWYKLKPNVCKGIMMLIQRAQTPISLTAGKLIILSNFSFMQVMYNFQFHSIYHKINFA